MYDFQQIKPFPKKKKYRIYTIYIFTVHPKVKLFISHGGMSGVYEAVDGGVPVLGIPLFYDQPRNIEHLVRAGMAISVELLSVTRKKLFDSISELINDEK